MAEGQAESERTFLGLTHNPFVEPQRGFFERGGRKTHLEQLRHLSQWSRRVLLVTGAEGVGKTTLYRELAATLEPRVKAARISGSLVNTGFEVLAATAQGFGLALPPDANTQSLRLDLTAHVEEQTAADRLCLALVDDAHLLDNKALDSLIALAHESGMHLVFFGEVRMVPLIERAASTRGVGWQEIRLTGYGEADARDYLEWRFSQAKYRGRIPFTDNQVKDLVKLSEGLPGRINQMANVLLVKLETGETAPARQGFPRVHAALLTLLVVVVGLLYLVVGDGDPEQAPDVAATEQEATGSEQEATGSEQEVTAAAEEDLLPDSDSTSAEEVEAAPIGMVAADDAVADESAAGEPTPAADAPEQVSPAPDQSVPEAPVAPAAEAEPVVADVADPVPVEAVETPEPAVAVATDAQAVEEPLTSGAKNTRWLLEQDPDYFTIQLVTVSAAESATAFVAKQQAPAEFTIYQLQRDGRILHSVLYGLFSSRAAAERAADNLPDEVGRVQPWIRPVGQVQAAARLSTLQ